MLQTRISYLINVRQTDINMIKKRRASYRDNSRDSRAQTCLEDGLYHLAPLVPPVGDDGDDVSLPHLQTGYSKSAVAGPELLFNSLSTIKHICS